MHKVSIRFVIVVMTLTVTLTTMLIYNGVFGNLAGETFTQMDLKLVTQNVSRAKEQLTCWCATRRACPTTSPTRC